MNHFYLKMDILRNVETFFVILHFSTPYLMYRLSDRPASLARLLSFAGLSFPLSSFDPFKFQNGRFRQFGFGE